jgi:hypothetical protein
MPERAIDREEGRAQRAAFASAGGSSITASRSAMGLKGWIDRARKAAEEVAQRVVPGTEPNAAGPARTEAAPPAEPAPVRTGGSGPPGREPTADVLARVKSKAEHGLKPEDRLVVVYFTRDVMDDVIAIRESLAGVDTVVREMDLGKEPPQTSRQLAELTGVMVPPYVYINGRYWGGRYDVESLRVSGDLEPVVANRLDEIGEEARRLGKIRDTYSDDISVENILARWRMGHILCVDDLDAWFEVDKDGTERFFHQGGPGDVARIPEIAEEIVRAVEAGEYEATWQLEPSVHMR